jgi:transposase-like protein
MGAGFVQYFNSLLLDMARAAPRRFKNFGPPIVAVAKARGIGCDRSVRKWVRQPQTAGSANPEGGATTIDKIACAAASRWS